MREDTVMVSGSRSVVGSSDDIFWKIFIFQVDSYNKLETGDVKNRDCDSGDYVTPLSAMSSLVEVLSSKNINF